MDHCGIAFSWWVARKGPLGFSLRHTTHPHLGVNQVFNLFQSFSGFLEMLDSKELCHFDVSVGNCLANEDLSGGFLIDFSSLTKYGSEVKNPTFTRLFTPYHHLQIIFGQNSSKPLIAEPGDDLESLLLTMLYLVCPNLKIFQKKGDKLLAARRSFLDVGTSLENWTVYYSQKISAKYAKLVPFFAAVSFHLFTNRNVSNAFSIIKEAHLDKGGTLVLGSISE